MPCGTLPPMSELNITTGHVEKVACWLQGAASQGGLSAVQ